MAQAAGDGKLGDNHPSPDYIAGFINFANGVRGVIELGAGAGHNGLVAAAYAAKAGKKVLVVEDGPTLTHGEMKIGAGVVAARKFGAAGLVDPRPYTVGRLTETFEIYPEIGELLPAMGYCTMIIGRLASSTAIRYCWKPVFPVSLLLETFGVQVPKRLSALPAKETRQH